ncbi:hypothetical protein QDY72_03220 [Kingella negevensis]|uniref:hypothetical protein n=1 Tax=Kingella negevensis TaxID=1522312 RepID=UPI0015DB0BF0|nr:hypothetical protein [Kingella negevensis]MDK4679626.1 hypothetical protein [Kingella negevensis]MDK4682655.1 hypothetical protein [Kingella negevensis]MDK4684198.1 hypothetical protein [Kingella negevensis]MDK4690852.1 hypothetical protein [Kingella negevensis]MDK4694001.1 hypothetical protein [Kingella negevensis]
MCECSLKTIFQAAFTWSVGGSPTQLQPVACFLSTKSQRQDKINFQAAKSHR